MSLLKVVRASFAAMMIAAASLTATVPTAAQAQAASAPEAAAAPKAAAVAEEAVDNPYGLKALWSQGDFVADAAGAVFVSEEIAWFPLDGLAGFNHGAGEPHGFVEVHSLEANRHRERGHLVFR